MSASVGEARAIVDRVRELLGDTRHRIQLDGLVAEVTAATLAELRDDRFSTRAQGYDAAAVQRRLDEYHVVVQDLLGAAILIARWGEPAHIPTLQPVLRELGEYAASNDGIVGWQIVRWVPCFSLLYASGIAALVGDRWPMFAGLYAARRGVQNRSDESSGVVYHAIDSVKHGWSETFKQLSAYERQYAAASNYMFDRLRPTLDELIHAASAYDDAFDRFEVLNALAYASLQQEHNFWGPPGRFAWQYRSGGRQVFKEVEAEAESRGASWPITLAGMFGGSHETFVSTAARYREFMKRLPWH